jgi:O-antigen/teichoic acid export membrane protein
LFPEAAISLLFGDKYLMTTTAFQLIAIAYFSYVFLGPNGSTITVYGKNKIKMLYTLICGVINIVLNYFLIPLYGIEGAAISSMISLIIINLSHASYLYKISGIHPIRKKFVLPVFITFIIMAIFYYIVYLLHLENLFILYKIIICILFSGLYFLIILLSKSFDKEDLQLLFLLEKRTGIRINFLKKIINKFI